MTRQFPAWISLAVGVVLTIFASLAVRNFIERDAAEKFALASDRVALKIQERLGAYALTLRGGAGLFAAANGIGRREWQAYVEKLRAQDSVPGVQGIGYSKLIAPRELPGHIASVRAEGFPDYTVRPAGARAFYTSIIYLEPFRDRNLRAFGFDMYSEPVRRAAMERARDTGAPGLSGKVELVQETGTEVQAGTLMYVPVYRNGAPTDTVEQRRSALTGWVYSPYRMNDLMEGILAKSDGQKAGGVGLHIYDGNEANAEYLLFDGRPATSEGDPRFVRERVIEFGGRNWLLRFAAPPGSVTVDYGSVWATLAGGFALSGLLCGLVLSLARTQSRAREIADTLTTELRRSSDSLRESELRWKFALEGSGDGVWDWSVPQDKVFFSLRWKEMLGYSDVDIGNGLDEWSKRVHPDDLNGTMADIKAHLDGKAPVYVNEHRVLCKDGSWKWILDRGLVVERDASGKPQRMVGTHTDITERKLAEEAIRRSEERLQHIVDSTVDWVWEVDSNGVYTYASPKVTELLGYLPEEIVGKTPFDLMPPEEAARVGAEFARIVAERSPIRGLENINRHKDGRIVVFETSGFALFDAQGKFAGYCGMDRDITDRKRAEMAQQDRRDWLEREVAARTEALTAAKDAAEAANRAKSAFLSTMSHELRTPMTAIMGMTDLALRRATDPKQADHLRTAMNASEHLLDVINDILDLSKIEADRMTLKNVAFSLIDVLDNLNALVVQKAANKGLRLVTELNPGLAMRRFIGDPTRLGQVLLNLAGNAIKFTEAGEIAVRARLVQDNPGDVVVRWEVSDTGIGIEPEARDRLFLAFEQADNSITRQYGGTGLGLAISKRLVEMMGGAIGVDSTPGQGSTFWFTVRLGEPAIAQSATANAESGVAEKTLHARHTGTRVLLAEDEPINRLVTGSLLEDVGILVDLAENGQKALELARQNPYTLILMDMQMPVMNGLDATRAIRLLPGHAKTPILAMTANAFDEDRESCIAAGMDDHLAKPFSPPKLFEFVLRWIGKDTRSTPA